MASASPCAEPRAAGTYEEYGATWWNITNGLPQSSINALVQKDDGELWIATYSGFLCFDGVEFRRFDIDTLPGLRSNRITALCDDGARGLWLTTQEGGLHHWTRNGIDRTFQVPGDDAVIALLRARDGSLWTGGSNGGIQRCAEGTWSEVSPARGAGSYRGIVQRPDGIVCVAAGDEVVLLEPSGAELARMSAPSLVLALASDGGQGLWVGLVDGLARAHEGSVSRFEIEPALDAPVYAVLDDGRGALWLGTGRGATRVSTSPESAPPVRVRSSSDIPRGFKVRSILIDHERNVWLGGSEAGLMRLRPNRMRSFSEIAGRSSVTALCDDGEGGAWVGYANRGLTRLRADAEEPEDVALALPRSAPPMVHSLLRDRRGRVWVGVGDAWMRDEGDAGEDFAPVLTNQRFPPAVGPMAQLRSGDVWLSTRAGHLTRLDANDAIREELEVPGPVFALAVGPDDSLWVGSGDEVVHVSASGMVRYGAEHGLPAGTVRDLLPESDGGVWIATYGGGLARLADGSARRITGQNGLQDSALSRILLDEQDRMWMLSNTGLMIADRADLLDVLAGRRARVDPVAMGVEAGMNEGTFGGPAGFEDAAGRLWFATIAGAVRIDAREFPFHRAPPEARILGVHADEAALASADTLEIPPGTRRLLFEFTAFALTAPERIRFRYRLDGYDEDWIDGDRSRRASYTALSPGGYTFRVLARNEDGVWSREPASLQLEILPAWWQTPIFRAFLVLLAIGALYALHRLRIGIVQRRAQALLAATKGRVLAEERSSRLRDELAHVARVATAGELATSLAHEVNQPLAAIVTNAEAARRFLARDGTSSADLDAILRDIAQQGERASEVIRRLRQFLRKHETERSALDVNELVHETLPLVRRELEDHDAIIELDLVADLPSIAADGVQIQQVLVNLVKNACDAMSDQAGERRIRVCTRKSSGGIALEVHDTGPGIAAAVCERLFLPYVTTKPTGMGLGLAICRTIVEAHGGRVGLVPGTAVGAAFRVDLPADARRKGKQ